MYGGIGRVAKLIQCDGSGYACSDFFGFGYGSFHAAGTGS
jgi:hypothetical protein